VNEWIVIKIDNSNYDDPIHLLTFKSEEEAKKYYDAIKEVYEYTILTKALEETDNSVKEGD
jgi:hypothetical protein